MASEPHPAAAMAEAEPAAVTEARSVRTTLGLIAERFALELQGDPETPIDGVCALAPGRPGALSFCADARLRAQLAQTQAGAVIVLPRDAAECPRPALVAVDPALAFAAVAGLFDRSHEFAAGIHAAASVAASATIGAGCGIGPGAVVEDGAVIGEQTYIGPNCIVRRGARIGAQSRLEANVYLGPDCVLGARARVLPGAVIGGRGFGLAKAKTGWVEVPQLGRVVVGDDVEIGANTCIDRGALDDTVIEHGVKLDNHIQIAHNCRIGAHTAIAACVGIAGSTQIGANCLIAGAAGIGGHLKIVDNVVILGRAMVTKSIAEAGVYGSGLPAQPAREWRKLIARIRRLPGFELRLQNIEKTLRLAPPSGEGAGEQDDF
ncbi:MAG: UDP-3-O-(3-hydroxymyristoyl)glucosamine N-acyltransferase [Nevskia sp.]